MVETPKGEMFTQYGCLKFPAKRDGGPKLGLAIKNKWSMGWTKTWFYCCVPCLCNSKGGKSVYALHSQMNVLDYTVVPEVKCPDDDTNDTTFIQVTTTMWGQDTVEEFMACKMYPLASCFGIRGVTIGTTHVSKVWISLSLFPIEAVSAESASHILVDVETEAERILGSIRPREDDVLTMMKLPNGGYLNHIFEQMGVAYAPHPLPGCEASQAARDN
jgi:hypothetical protein